MKAAIATVIFVYYRDVSNGQILLQDDQIARAHELIGILNFASELKKEKCYDSNEASDGKTVKELRFLKLQVTLLTIRMVLRFLKKKLHFDPLIFFFFLTTFGFM